jgi:hypothetical protein
MKKLHSVILLLLLISAAHAQKDSVLALSNNVQLFLDDYLIAQMENVKRVLQQPARHPENPLLVQEHPWEKFMVKVMGNASRLKKLPKL